MLTKRVIAHGWNWKAARWLISVASHSFLPFSFQNSPVARKIFSKWDYFYSEPYRLFSTRDFMFKWTSAFWNGCQWPATEHGCTRGADEILPFISSTTTAVSSCRSLWRGIWYHFRFFWSRKSRQQISQALICELYVSLRMEMGCASFFLDWKKYYCNFSHRKLWLSTRKL